MMGPSPKPAPIFACIAANDRKTVTRCGRSPEREFLFDVGAADYACAHYDSRTNRIPFTSLSVCHACVDVRKRELAEQKEAAAK